MAQALPEPLHSAGAAGCCLTVTTFHTCMECDGRLIVAWRQYMGGGGVGGPGGWVDGS